jgi:hypothetical protein
MVGIFLLLNDFILALAFGVLPQLNAVLLEPVDEKILVEYEKAGGKIGIHRADDIFGLSCLEKPTQKLVLQTYQN